MLTFPRPFGSPSTPNPISRGLQCRETLLLHRSSAASFLEQALPVFAQAGVELRGDAASQAGGLQGGSHGGLAHRVLDLILSVRVVDDLQQALDHIAQNGSRHTEVLLNQWRYGGYLLAQCR